MPTSSPCIVFAVAGGTGALAGAVITPIVLANWDAGFLYGLKGFIGAIMGGLRSPTIAVVAGLGVGVAESLAAGYLSSGWKDAIVYGAAARLPAGARRRVRVRPRRPHRRDRRPMTGKLGLGPTALALGVFAALVILYPLVFSSSYGVGVGITAGAMAAGSVGFVLLLGYAHQLALGQAGFCMIGGYASAILCVRYRWDPTLAMLVGAVLSMAVAWVVAVPILKLRGFVLAMGSLALHLILIVFAFELPALTGGALGTYGVQRFALFGITLTTDLAYYFLVWAIVLLFVAIGLNIDRSCVGRALKAIAVSEMAAGSVGIDIVKHKVQMFVVAAGMASVVGQPVRALPARDGSDRVRLRLQPQPDHRGHHRRIDVDLGRGDRRHRRHRPARGVARLLAADVGIRHHGRAHGDRADRLSARLAGFIGKAFATARRRGRRRAPLARRARRQRRCRPAPTGPRRASRCCK